jgi:hypothetical protein
MPRSPSCRWYSTQAGGNCDDPAATECQWRVVETVQTVNASCVNDNLHKGVVAANSSCFAACPDPTDVRSDCYITCFYTTLFSGKIDVMQLVQLWQKGCVERWLNFSFYVMPEWLVFTC